MIAAPISDVLPESVLVAHLLRQASQPLAAATRARLAQALLDWFTAGWSAQDMPAAATLRGLAQTLMPGAGEAALFGGQGATPLAAGFANAGIAHLREIDDAHRAAMLHPGVVAITPVLALASSLGLTHERAARAIVAGYEVALRLGEALGARHAGLFHATATAGAVGAAAAAGMAMGLDAPRLHHALGIAATQAAGLWQLVDDDAHESKSLHPAFAVRNGMTAAFAARAGLPGARAFFTGRRGMYAALAGEGPLAAVAEGLDAPERLHTATIKAWPACAMLFTPLDAMRALIEEHRIGAADVQAMEIEIFPHALKIAGVQWPARPAEASFCLRYLLAVLLEKGGVLGIADTEAPDLDNPGLRALAARMQVRPNEAFQQAFPQRRPSRVTLMLRDGRQISAYRDLRRGDPEDPYNWAGLQQRMRSFAPAMEEAQAAALVRWCEGFTDAAQDALPCAPAGALFGAA
ncbi:MmgE/PrpD family protein [Variovorax sp. VRV01]|uniref:MmgE/PrpD family protein n=1 Tax=Variovorax sp. VRV01 TaxID=2769259 RepID=UPI0017877AA5|nr:MmgE/PrpD family protein [Variovorax sp. VRV01]MBD9667405.1 MmgE/PrpD family protein [Variovorax sp. VRV01]